MKRLVNCSLVLIAGYCFGGIQGLGIACVILLGLSIVAELT